MWKQSMWTSTISSHLATKHLKEGGLLTLAGAKAALEGTPGKLHLAACEVGVLVMLIGCSRGCEASLWAAGY